MPPLFRTKKGIASPRSVDAAFSNTFLPPLAHSYAPPTPLEDLHILDFLELAGSQAKAGAALALHQSTVCRSLQLMQQQFQLLPRRGAPVCRHGHNSCLGYLRLAYREHRLMAGLIRLGTDLLHQGLLDGMTGVQLVPPRFRSAEQWAELVSHGLLDGAIVSSLCLEQLLLFGQTPKWDGLIAIPLGQLALQLVATTTEAKQVLLPHRSELPLLHRALEWHGLGVEQQPKACQEAAAWLKRARDRKLAIPICDDLLEPGWLEAKALLPLTAQPPLMEQLWLLLPRSAANSKAARLCLRLLRVRINRAEAMRDLRQS